jgi:hypothetical protein
MAQTPTDRLVELLACSVYYHHRDSLGLAHTVPIGEPWLPGSDADHLLVSRPYPFGADLEICPLTGTHAHILWLLPITKAERDYGTSQGIQALEALFEQQQLAYWRPDRPSIVPGAA